MYTKNLNILGIDWGKKYIGLAYLNKKTQIIMPIGNIFNDEQLFFSLAEILHRYHIGTIVIGYPKQHKDSQTDIDAFLKNISFLDPNIKIIKTNEEYTSVQAGAKINHFGKHASHDTLSAMHILEYFKTQSSKQNFENLT